MYGCKATEKKEIEKARQKLGCQLLLSKEIILGHPCVPRVRVTRLAIRTKPEKQGAELVGGGGGGADTRREGLMQDFM